MSCAKIPLTATLCLMLLQNISAQQTILVDISAKLTSINNCKLNVIPVAMNSISIQLRNNLNVNFINEQQPASVGLIVSHQIPLIGSSFVGNLRFQAQFSYDLCECTGSAPGGCPSLSGSFIDQIIPINFNSSCLINNSVYSHNGANFTLYYSFTLAMTAPEVTPVSATCNTDFVNLQVNNTAPSYNWQVRNPLSNWITFRENASNAIVATRQELQAAAGNGAYATRNVRVVESGCLTNRQGPSSDAFNFHAPAPAISVIFTNQTCRDIMNGSLAVTITSALPPTVNDFIVSLHDPTQTVDPKTGYAPAITEIQLENSSNYSFQNLGVTGNSSKTFYVTVQNNTDNNTYGSCTAVSQNYNFTNPDPITTNFMRSLKNGYDISCNGGSNGQVSVSPSGGAGGFKNFLWSNGVTSQSISGLSAGNYSVSYQDGNNCLASGDATITQPPALSVSIQSNNKTIYNNFDVSCSGALNGSITANASGGAGGHSYQWSDGNGGAIYSGIGVGNYSVTVTDGNGCMANSNITLTAPPPIAFSIEQVSGIDCPNVSTGSLSVNPADIQNEIGTVSYAWSNGVVGASNTIQNLPAGNYHVTITDEQGCTAYAQRSLTNPAPYTVSIAPQSNYDGHYISCSSAADGILQATLFDSNQGIQTAQGFNWYKGEVSAGVGATAYGLNEGNYRVIASYGNNCTAEQTYFLNAPEPYTTTISVQSNYHGATISCNGASDGVLAVTLFNEAAEPTPVEYYAWSRNGVPLASGELLSSIHNLSEGEYSVITTYQGGCTSNGAITLSDPDPVNVQIQANTDYHGYVISCVDADNGALLAVASGGTPGAYTYAWDTGTENALLENIGAGVYTVTTHDINNCPAFSNFIIEDPPPLTASIEVTSDFSSFPISCHGQADGALLATATGGTDHYTYQWNTGVHTAALTHIPAGEYEVMATDENGCTAQANLSISDPAPVAVSIFVLSDYNGQHITCASAANGRLEAIATGGTNTFSYSWSMGTNGSIQNGLPAGLYEVLATDANGCQAVNQKTLIEPLPVSVSILNTSDYNGFGVSCAGMMDGFIEVAAVGGTGVYLYSWLNETETSNVLEGLGQGNYTATVTDNNGCSDDVSHVITEPQVLTLQVIDKHDVTCFGGNNGEISIQANGGVDAYTFAINQLDATNENQFSLLTAGDYTLHVYDWNNCHATTSHTLVQPSQIEIAFENIEPAFCSDPRGRASALVTGGVMNYVYRWKNNVAEIIDEDHLIENLAAGLYSLEIIDGNNCEASKFLGIQATDGPILTTREIVPAKCSYSSDGSITMEVIQGDGPFTFQWQDGQTSATALNLSQGEYFVMVEDVNNCQTVSSAIVSAPTPLAVTLLELKPPSCYGLSDGSIEVLGTGGTAPYAYDWGIFQGSLFSGRSKGNSYLTLYDANQCSTQASYSMSEPPPLSLDLVSRVLPRCYGECNGAMQVVAMGGNGNYSYNWSSGSEAAVATNLCSDNHTVSVQDAKGCTFTRNYSLGQPAPLLARLLSREAPDCHDGCNGELVVDATGGAGNYTYAWSNGQTNTTAVDLCAGTHAITIQDANACEVQQIHVLENPAPLAIDLGENRTICEGQTHTLSVEGVWLKYDWSSNVNFRSEAPQIVISQAGQYWLEVADALGCVARDTFLLETSTDLLEASFIIPSEANVNDTIVIIDITWPMAESISWKLPTDLVVIQNLNEVVYGKFLKAGTYNIGLRALLAGCHDEITKTISIAGAAALAQDELLGYQEFVKTFEIYPNPTQGAFMVRLQFEEETLATLSIWEVLTGKTVKQINLESDKDFNVNMDLHPLPPGSYILRMDYSGGVKYLRFVVN